MNTTAQKTKKYTPKKGDKVSTLKGSRVTRLNGGFKSNEPLYVGTVIGFFNSPVWGRMAKVQRYNSKTSRLYIQKNLVEYSRKHAKFPFA